MQLQDILQAMRTWNQSRNQQGTANLQSWLSQGNMFAFQAVQDNPPINGQQEAFLHAYPGIVNGVLNFFVIPSSKDISSTQNIENYIKICPAVTGQPSQATSSSGNITPQQAMQRIQDWHNNSNNWIAANAGTTNSVYSVMCIPQGDTILGTQHDAFFALEANTTAPGGYTADLIVEDADAQQVVFFDMVQPVPPFSSGALAASSFYLLSLV